MKNIGNNNNEPHFRIILATLIATFLMYSWMKIFNPVPNATPKKEVKKIVKTEEKIIAEEIYINKKEKIKQEIIKEDKKIKILTDKLTGSIDLRGLIFDDLTLENYKVDLKNDNKIKILNNKNSQNSYYVNISWSSEDKTLELPNQDTLWTSSRDDITLNNPAILTYINKDNIKFQVYLSIDDDYMLTIKQSIINNSNKTTLIKVNNSIIKKEAESNTQALGVHEGFIGSFNNQVEELKYKKIKKRNYNFNNYSWAGFTDNYWLVSLSTETSKNKLFNIKTEYNDKNYKVNFVSDNLIINPNEKEEISSYLFAGPKILSLLDQYLYQYDLKLFDRAVDFGWFYFLTKPIYIILRAFFGFFGNFGIAILLLTFIIKMVMFPFTKKSYISMMRIKELQPKIQLLKNQYSNDKMKLNKEMMELYKKEKINPLSGIVPLFVQIPVFFSLYKVLAISIDMRQAPFFGYIKNLADKDPTSFINLFGLLPFEINTLQIGFLPCLMCLTMWLQQKMTTQPGMSKESETATKILPIIFLFMFAGMPAGLLIYWTFSNVITIGQQYYIEKKFAK